MKTTHDLKCETAKLMAVYVDEPGLDWSDHGDPLEIGQYLLSEEEYADDEGDRDRLKAVQDLRNQIEDIAKRATAERVAGKTAEEMEQVCSELLLDVLLGQSPEQVDYRGRD